MAVVSRPFKPDRAPDRPRRMFRFMPLLTAVTYVLALLAIVVLAQRAMTWGQRWLDDVRYGFPRSARISGIVAPGDVDGLPTQIIALNMYGQVSILVLPGSDATQVQVLEGPYLFGRDGAYAVARPTLYDVNGNGQADLLVTIRGEAIVYLNDNGTLRLMTPEERAELVGSGRGALPLIE